MDGAQAFDYLIHHVRHRGRIGHIAGDSEGGRAVFVLQLPGKGSASVPVQVHYGHLRPKFGEAPAKPLAEDSHGAGDDGGFSF
jgi:hypothetical protein